MPDLDIIPRTAAPGWKTASKLLEGNGTDDEIVRAILRSLSCSLRREGGLPCLDGFINVVGDFERGELTYAAAMMRVRTIVRLAEGHHLAKVAERSVSYVLVDVAAGEALPSNLHQAVAERFLWCLADHCLIDRRRPELVGTKYADYDEAFATEERYKAILGPSVSRMAANLLRNPTAVHLRAPPIADARTASVRPLYVLPPSPRLSLGGRSPRSG